MTKLPSIQGLRDANAITVTFHKQLLHLIESQCRAEWVELNRLDHPNETASPFIPADEWLATREGNTHKMLADVFFLNPNAFNMSKEMQAEISKMYSRLQARRYNVQGTRKRFEKRLHSATDYRRFRNWWINRHYSRLAGLEFKEPCPFTVIEQEAPATNYIEIGRRFEAWTQRKLPEKAWALLKEMQDNREQYEKQYLSKAA